jgi:1-deoxy-D-xylulose-5-phosphate reductoisomerase
MIKKIAILGSTGSIGQSTLDVIYKKKENFKVVLLTANNNYKKLIKQAKLFNAQNVIIKNSKHYLKVKYSLKKNKTKVFTGNVSLKNIVSSKLDYTMSSIVGLAGLQPTVDAMKLSKVVAIANKETIICGWSILSKLQKKYKTKILPVDSEHFSIMNLTEDIKDKDVEEIIITASGGPFLKNSLNSLKNIKPKEAIKHPNWKMGKKISIDSANLMNKVFEVVEANKIFNFSKKKYKVMIHPQSYVHSIIRFKNGLTKMILYGTDMKIPISNTLYGSKNNVFNDNKIKIEKLNKISFQNVDKRKFPSILLIDKCLNMGPSAPTIVNASNEVLVNLFLRRKIRFLDIVKNINNIFKDKDFKKYARRTPQTIKEVKIIDNWARLKTNNMCVQ